MKKLLLAAVIVALLPAYSWARDLVMNDESPMIPGTLKAAYFSTVSQPSRGLPGYTEFYHSDSYVYFIFAFWLDTQDHKITAMIKTPDGTNFLPRPHWWNITSQSQYHASWGYLEMPMAKFLPAAQGRWTVELFKDRQLVKTATFWLGKDAATVARLKVESPPPPPDKLNAATAMPPPPPPEKPLPVIWTPNALPEVRRGGLPSRSQEESLVRRQLTDTEWEGVRQ